MSNKARPVVAKLAPEPGAYSHAVVVDVGTGTLVELSGQCGDIPGKETDYTEIGGIRPQTTRALLNIEEVIRKAGEDVGVPANRDNITKIRVFIVDMENNKPAFEEAYQKFFGWREFLPARVFVEVAGIPLSGDPAIVELEAQAFIPRSERMPRRLRWLEKS